VIAWARQSESKPKPTPKPKQPIDLKEPPTKEHKGYVAERYKLEVCTQCHWPLSQLPSCVMLECGKCSKGYTNHPPRMKNTNPQEILDKYNTIPCRNWKASGKASTARSACSATNERKVRLVRASPNSTTCMAN